MSSAKPFKVNIPNEELDYVKQRLQSARYPDQLTNIAAWEDGTDLAYFKEFVRYWQTSYDWRKSEAQLNSFAQFTQTIQGINMHYVHEPADSKDAIPLLLLHGWPGSYFEFYKLIPLLKATGRFHIVVPSLPGYGFSSAPQERGCGVTAMAGIMDSLMAALGYTRYIAQGGDWGAIICRAIAKYHSARCAAIHLNMCVAQPSYTNPLHILQGVNALLLPQLPLLLTSTEIQRVQDMKKFQSREAGYQKIQGTKPQTLAYALQDSPVGTAAWILEKLRGWSDCDGNPDNVFSKDEMLTNICIYIYGGRIASSIRLYKETFSSKEEMKGLFTGYVAIPTGVAIFPRELYKPPRSWANALYNIVHWTEQPKGGHFAALEQAQLLFDDLMAFVDKVKSQL